MPPPASDPADPAAPPPDTRRRWLTVRWIVSLVGAALVGALVALALAPDQRQAPAPGAAATTLRVVEREGLSAALDTLQRVAAADNLVRKDGHQLAHTLGRRAVAASRGDASVITQCTPIFASGCYHGVVEAFIQFRGTVDMPALERLCAAAGNERPGAVYECVHGAGHGVLGAVGLDARAALRHCDELASPAFAASCRSGVFMEAINAAVGDSGVQSGHGAHHGGAYHAGAHPAPSGRLTLDAADPYAPCNGFEGDDATACWLFQGFVILRSTGFDPRSALGTCDGAPDDRAGACYESIGHQLTGLFLRDDRWIVEQCGLGQPALAPRCAGGAALALTGMDWTGRRATRFCASAPVAWRSDCYRAAATLLAELASPDDAAQLCARAKAEDIDACATPAPASHRPRS